jgi:5-methylcytosine-specific restriction endonuclease McrA
VAHFCCAGCFRTYPAPRRRGRCPDCEREYYRERRKRRGSTTQRGLGHTHQQLREQVLAEEKLCWLCGKPATAGDPLVADHVIPRSRGGATTRANLRAAHASCNARRGQAVARPRSRLTPAPARREEDAREEVTSPIKGKWCCSCRQWLTVEAFRPNPNNRNGIDSWCRPCHAKAVREWRVKNGVKYNAKRRREYREAYPLVTRPCVVCGKPMRRPANVLVCGHECRRQRKIEQRRALRAVRLPAALLDHGDVV